MRGIGEPVGLPKAVAETGTWAWEEFEEAMEERLSRQRFSGKPFDALEEEDENMHKFC